MSEMQGLFPGGQNGAHSEVGHDPGSIKNGKVPEECGAVVARAAALRDFQEVIPGLREEEGGQEVVQPMVEENWVVQPIEQEEEGEEEQEVEENEQEDEEDDAEDENKEDEDEEEGEEWMDEGEESGHDDYDKGEDEEEGEEDGYGGDNENYVDREQEENVPESISFFNKEETEYNNENSDEEAQEPGSEEEGNESEEPEKRLKVDMDLAEDSHGESSGKAY